VTPPTAVSFPSTLADLFLAFKFICHQRKLLDCLLRHLLLSSLKMTLCATCKSIDFRPLLIACLQQCRDRQEANGEDYDAPLPSDNSSRVKHHDDIFEIEKSSGDCNFCKVIFQAFEKEKSLMWKRQGVCRSSSVHLATRLKCVLILRKD
jgi:hypothetical protein